jgi:hypothetical protein
MGFLSKKAVFGVGQTISVRPASKVAARKKAAGKKQARAGFIPPAKPARARLSRQNRTDEIKRAAFVRVKFKAGSAP